MGKIPKSLRETIARNIRECRMKKFPGRGGAKKCAETFGVSPQQWSPWERGMRTPDELRLQQMADFFEVTVAYLRHDNSDPVKTASPSVSGTVSAHPSSPDGMDMSSILSQFPVPGMPATDAPGSPASFYWLARHFMHHLMTLGVKVQLSDNSITLRFSNPSNLNETQ